MSSSTAQTEVTARVAPVPRGEKRRREIAVVAERIFFEHGFNDATMQAIAAEAGASKETLYRHFGSKEGLFSEIVENRSERLVAGLEANLERPGALAEVLQDFGLRMLETLTGPDGICLCRIVIAEGSRDSDLGALFFKHGPESVLNRMSRFLRACNERGELRCADTELAAKIFLGAVLTYHHMVGLVVPSRPPASRAEMKAHVDEVVALFLLRYRT